MNTAVVTVQVPRLTVADIVIELQGLVLCEYTDGVNARVDTVRQGEVDNAILTSKRNSRLCYILSERVQTASLTASQEH